MRWIAGFLVLLNVAIGGYFLWGHDQSGLKDSPHLPINADRILLQSTHLAVDQPRVPDQKQQVTSVERFCVEWRGLTETDLTRARESVKELATQRVLSVEEQPVKRMYWVIFPPLTSAAAGQAKLRELEALNIREAFIIKEGPWKDGISLGLYAAEETARRRMREVEARGISGLRLEGKAKEGTNYYFLVRSEDASTLKDLDAIRQTYPATTIARVECGH